MKKFRENPTDRNAFRVQTRNSVVRTAETVELEMMNAFEKIVWLHGEFSFYPVSSGELLVELCRIEEHLFSTLPVRFPIVPASFSLLEPNAALITLHGPIRRAPLRNVVRAGQIVYLLCLPAIQCLENLDAYRPARQALRRCR